MDLFVWTATVAVVSGIIRWLGFPVDLSEGDRNGEFLIFFYGIAVLAIGTLLSIWIAMPQSPHVGRRIAISSFGMVMVISPILLMATSGPAAGEALFALLGTTALSMLLVAGPLLVLRNLGDRIVRIRRHIPPNFPSKSIAAAPIYKQNDSSRPISDAELN